MSLKKCTNCGVFFGAKDTEELCSACLSPISKKAVITGDAEHDKFANARAIVYDIPHISPDNLVKEMVDRGINITIREVMKYVNEGRLALVSEDGGSYCSSCGKKITIGTMCSNCSDKLEVFRTNTPKVVKKEEKQPVGKGMHTAR